MNIAGRMTKSTHAHSEREMDKVKKRKTSEPTHISQNVDKYWKIQNGFNLCDSYFPSGRWTMKMKYWLVNGNIFSVVNTHQCYQNIDALYYLRCWKVLQHHFILSFTSFFNNRPINRQFSCNLTAYGLFLNININEHRKTPKQICISRRKTNDVDFRFFRNFKKVKEVSTAERWERMNSKVWSSLQYCKIILELHKHEEKRFIVRIDWNIRISWL